MSAPVNINDIREYIKANGALFWYIPEEEKQHISLEVLVETILNWGDKNTVKRLFSILGIDTVACIFNKQLSNSRSNYHPQVLNYFKIYFERHASGNIDKTSN